MVFFCSCSSTKPPLVSFSGLVLGVCLLFLGDFFPSPMTHHIYIPALVSSLPPNSISNCPLDVSLRHLHLTHGPNSNFYLIQPTPPRNPSLLNPGSSGQTSGSFFDYTLSLPPHTQSIGKFYQFSQNIFQIHLLLSACTTVVQTTRISCLFYHNSLPLASL